MFQEKEAHVFKRPPLCQLPGSLFRHIAWFLNANEKCLLSRCSRHCDTAICGARWTPVSGEWLCVVTPPQHRWMITHGIAPTRADFKTPNEVHAWIDWSQLERVSILRETQDAFVCKDDKGWTVLFDDKLPQLHELTLRYWCKHMVCTASHWSKLVELHLNFAFTNAIAEGLLQCLEKADCPNMTGCTLQAGCPLPLIASGRLKRLRLHASFIPNPIFRLGRNKYLEIDAFVFPDHPDVQLPESVHVKKWLVDQNKLEYKQLEALMNRHSHCIDAVEHNGTILSSQNVLSGIVKINDLHTLADSVHLDMNLKVRICSLSELRSQKRYTMISFVEVLCDIQTNQLLCDCIRDLEQAQSFASSDPKYVTFFTEKIQSMFPHAEIACHWCKRSLV